MDVSSGVLKNFRGDETDATIYFTFFIACTMAGCTYHSEALTVKAPASEVRIDRQVGEPVSVFIDPEIEFLSSDAAENSYACSAHSFPVTIGPAIKSSIVNILEEAFTDVQIVESNQTSPRDGFYMSFRKDTFRPTIFFAAGFWQGTANASSEIVLKVTTRYFDQIIFDEMTIADRGFSNGQHKGGCNVGAGALKDAGKESIKRLLENLVYKVINTVDFRYVMNTYNTVS